MIVKEQNYRNYGGFNPIGSFVGLGTMKRQGWSTKPNYTVGMGDFSFDSMIPSLPVTNMPSEIANTSNVNTSNMSLMNMTTGGVSNAGGGNSLLMIGAVILGSLVMARLVR